MTLGLGGFLDPRQLQRFGPMASTLGNMTPQQPQIPPQILQGLGSIMSGGFQMPQQPPTMPALNNPTPFGGYYVSEEQTDEEEQQEDDGPGFPYITIYDGEKAKQQREEEERAAKEKEQRQSVNTYGAREWTEYQNSLDEDDPRRVDEAPEQETEMERRNRERLEEFDRDFEETQANLDRIEAALEDNWEKHRELQRKYFAKPPEITKEEYERQMEEVRAEREDLMHELYGGGDVPSSKELRERHHSDE